MEEVIQKLSEIEITAKKIMEDAENKKQELTDDMRRQIQDYDHLTEEEASQKIAEIRASLEKDKETQVNELRDHTQRVFASLDQYYESNHTRLAQEIYQRIIST